jgi:hypothetical protein
MLSAAKHRLEHPPEGSKLIIVHVHVDEKKGRIAVLKQPDAQRTLQVIEHGHLEDFVLDPTLKFLMQSLNELALFSLKAMETPKDVLEVFGGSFGPVPGPVFERELRESHDLIRRIVELLRPPLMCTRNKGLWYLAEETLSYHYYREHFIDVFVERGFVFGDLREDPFEELHKLVKKWAQRYRGDPGPALLMLMFGALSDINGRGLSDSMHLKVVAHIKDFFDPRNVYRLRQIRAEAATARVAVQACVDRAAAADDDAALPEDTLLCTPELVGAFQNRFTDPPTSPPPWPVPSMPNYQLWISPWWIYKTFINPKEDARAIEEGGGGDDGGGGGADEGGGGGDDEGGGDAGGEGGGGGEDGGGGDDDDDDSGADGGGGDDDTDYGTLVQGADGDNDQTSVSDTCDIPLDREEREACRRDVGTANCPTEEDAAREEQEDEDGHGCRDADADALSNLMLNLQLDQEAADDDALGPCDGSEGEHTPEQCARLRKANSKYAGGDWITG